MEITFGNGFKAELVKNVKEKKCIARLYSPDDVFLTSVYCEEEYFTTVAEALMNGYFAGWNNCRIKTKRALMSTVESVSMYSNGDMAS